VSGKEKHGYILKIVCTEKYVSLHINIMIWFWLFGSPWCLVLHYYATRDYDIHRHVDQTDQRYWVYKKFLDSKNYHITDYNARLSTFFFVNHIYRILVCIFENDRKTTIWPIMRAVYRRFSLFYRTHRNVVCVLTRTKIKSDHMIKYKAHSLVFFIVNHIYRIFVMSLLTST